MRIVNASNEILFITPEPLKKIEEARICYKSEWKIKENSDEEFAKMLLSKNHLTPIELADLMVKVKCSRATSHQIVRHRLLSISQMSQRYVNYSNERFGKQITFIKPIWVSDNVLGEWGDELPKNIDDASMIWFMNIRQAEKDYLSLLEKNCRPEQAREVLPNSTETELVLKGNFREWLHIFSLRTSIKADPEIRQQMIILLNEVRKNVPIIFDNI